MTADLDAFLRDGYLVLPDVFTSSEIDHFRQLRQAATRDWCFVNGQADEPIVVGDLLERHPRTMLEVVTHPSILGLAESIMGPFVQLD